MNLFGTILTYTAPSANYRGEGAENRAVIQKITNERFEFAIISPEAMRNALRETLKVMGLLCNRTRLNNEEQLAVKFKDYPDADKYADDFFMGWLIAASGKDRKNVLAELNKKKRDINGFTFKRDSILRMNMAVALEPYRHDSIFTQSPQDKTPKDIKQHTNVENAQLLHRETTYSAFQYPFALNLEECRSKADWTKILLKAIGELSDVAGNHARSYFEFAPASIVVRLTKQLVAGYDTYGFKISKNKQHELPEIVKGILENDYSGSEFYIGGKLVKDMTENEYNALKNKGVKLFRSPQVLLKQVGNDAFSNK
ncbi:MAG: type I-B CRISPR-associated protein Cas7/Cst2/DevR [Planctomycetota bacterium]